MGILDRYLAGGTAGTNLCTCFTNGNNAATILDASTANSKLHYDDNGTFVGSYSINGQNASTVTTQQQQYNDGVPNLVPPPSVLDTEGRIPDAPLADGSFPGINNTFQNGTYRETLNVQGVSYAGTF